MNSIVQGLVEIERKAQSITRKVEQDYDDLPRLIDEKSKVAIDKINAELTQKLEEFRQNENKRLEAFVLKHKEVEAQALQAMETVFEENHGQWENEIIDRILNS